MAPAITAKLSPIAARTGGNIDTHFTDHSGVDRHTLAAAVKSADSTERKIRDDMRGHGLTAEQAAGAVKDSVRYTITYPPGQYADGAKAAMDGMKQAGFEPVRGFNAWALPRGYAGINTVWRDPASGQRFEMQFHTPDGLQFKEGIGHPMYEQQRSLPEGPAKEALTAQINAAWAPIRDAVPYLDHIDPYMTRVFPSLK